MEKVNLLQTWKENVYEVIFTNFRGRFLCLSKSSIYLPEGISICGEAGEAEVL
jgi:hypothetical protein